MLIRIPPGAKCCLTRSPQCSSVIVRRPLQWELLNPSARPFTQASILWRTQRPTNGIRNAALPQDELPESTKPKTLQRPLVAKSSSTPKADPLLSEQTVSKQEQRKADWAIMKEMAKYLWPKVCWEQIAQK